MQCNHSSGEPNFDPGGLGLWPTQKRDSARSLRESCCTKLRQQEIISDALQRELIVKRQGANYYITSMSLYVWLILNCKLQ